MTKLCKLSSTDSGFSYSTSVLVLFWNLFGETLQPLFPEQMDQAVYEGIKLSEHCLKASAGSDAVISIPIKTLEH